MLLFVKWFRCVFPRSHHFFQRRFHVAEFCKDGLILLDCSVKICHVCRYSLVQISSRQWIKRKVVQQWGWCIDGCGGLDIDIWSGKCDSCDNAWTFHDLALVNTSHLAGFHLFPCLYHPIPPSHARSTPLWPHAQAVYSALKNTSVAL